jgi:RNA polymerase sigma-70 factor (ECF subfamily)
MTQPVTADARLAAHRNHLLHMLMADHAKPLLSYADRMLGDRHLAEDIVQETLIRAWHRAEMLYSTEGSVRGWLLTVTRNLAIDRLRSAASRHETIGANHQDVLQPDHADEVLTSIETTALLRTLSPEHREVIVHTYLCGRSIQDTARMLGIPAGTVKSRQHYALVKLRSRAQ